MAGESRQEVDGTVDLRNCIAEFAPLAAVPRSGSLHLHWPEKSGSGVQQEFCDAVSSLPLIPPRHRTASQNGGAAPIPVRNT